jgi:hypothetical protein
VNRITQEIRYTNPNDVVEQDDGDDKDKQQPEAGIYEGSVLAKADS